MLPFEAKVSGSMEFDITQPEPSVLEYARFHNLCKDHTLEALDFFHVEPLSFHELEADLENTADILPTNLAIELTKERLAVSKDAALLLKEIHSMQQQPDEAPMIIDDWKWMSKLKQELPILQSDNELDVINFGNTNVPDLNNLRIPFEVVDDEKDEGLQWPSKYYALPRKCYEQAKAEKLQISKDVLLFLSDATRDTWTPQDSNKIKEESLNFKKRLNSPHVSPTLLPLSPPATPYVPSSPGNHLELLSVETSSVTAELKALDDDIMKDDVLPLMLDVEASYESMLFGDADAETFDPLQESLSKPASPMLKRKAQDLKVEGPLTPELFSESPIKKMKSVTFKEMVHEYIPELPSTFTSGDNILSSQDDFADFCKQVAPIVDEVNKNLESEKLSEVDTTKRVDVPNMDFVQPISPWAEFSRKKTRNDLSGESELDAQAMFLLRVKREDLKSVSSWHGVTKLERSLHWSPFPTQIASVSIEEKLHGEEVLGKMLAELTMGDIATSSTDIWKRDGLRILEDEDDNEEELEMADFKQHTLVDSLIEKRKLELEEETHETVGSRCDVAKIARLVRDRPKEDIACDQERRQTSYEQPPPAQKECDNSLMFGGMFSAAAALDRFMEIHGKPIAAALTKANETSTHFPPNISSALLVYSTKNPVLDVSQPTLSGALPDEMDGPMKGASLALPRLPSLPRELPPCSFIVSSTLLQRRSLAREIEKTYPDAEFIERDFGLPHSPAKEADLLMSPSTGLILTTLQQVKQRALPGQPHRSPIKERITRLQYRYERLVVLVSEGLNRKAEESGLGRPVDSRDKEAMAELEKFIPTMEAEVLSIYVQGGEMALARIIVREMVAWGLPHGSKDIGDVKLMQEETLWETFLRRAGLNPFAAQVILTSLKDPYHLPLNSSPSTSSDMPSKSVEVLSLPALILMPAEERVRRFQALLGGSRILTRVNSLLDQQWPSAAHGFRM